MSILEDKGLLRCDVLRSTRQVVTLRMGAGSYSETPIYIYIYIYAKLRGIILHKTLIVLFRGFRNINFVTYKSSTVYLYKIRIQVFKCNGSED